MGKWLETYGRSVPAGRLDRLYGMERWKRLLRACVPDPELDAWYRIPRAHGFLLHGPAANGKCALAMGLAGELGAVGYGFIHVPACALLGRGDEPAGLKTEELLEEILTEVVVQKGAGFCLLLEHLEALAVEEEAMWTLSRYISMIKEEDIPGVIIATAEDIRRIPGFAQKMFIPCLVELPDERERRLCLEQMFGDRLPSAPGFGCRKMAGMTEGFSYSRLWDLHRMAALALKQKAREFSKGDRQQMAKMVQTGGVVLTEELFGVILGQLGKGEKHLGVSQAAGGSVQAGAQSEGGESSPGKPFFEEVPGAAPVWSAAEGGIYGKEPPKAEKTDFLGSMMEMDLDEL